MIEVKKLNKTYALKNKKIEAINDLNIVLPEAGFVCIAGESGSGKTTLLNVLGGLETFSDGSIYYGDSILKKYKRKKYEDYRRSDFGYIFQN